LEPTPEQLVRTRVAAFAKEERFSATRWRF
jgi:hypothetical protein